jgi:signal transduction histidine kinase
MPHGGELVVTAYEGSREVEIEIADSGPGLATSAQRVFEPFYTTRHHATGLGLAIVKGVARAHGGNVTACNCPEGGAAFTIHLPRRALKAVA